MQHKCFFNKRIFIINFFSINNKIDSSTDGFRSFKICSACKPRVIVSMELITANGQFFQEFRIRNLCDISISIILFITRCIIIHCLLQSCSNSYIINNKTTFFVPEHTIYTSNSLHKIMS